MVIKSFSVRSAFFLLVLAVLLFGSQNLVAASKKPPRAVYEQLYEVRVTKVVDGDTVDVEFLGEIPPDCDKSCQRIRLIGVDTPEYYKKVRQPYADEAKEYTGRCLGTTMQLRLDWYTSYKDRYGRLLAYLYAEDGSMLNYELVRNGYGRYYSKFKFNKQDMASFGQAEDYAREHRLGLWGLDTGDGGQE
ncbi:MAG: thermonuclease family protein [Treponema sp.]|nr:thermonuclease family protein [Treponema sp.]